MLFNGWLGYGTAVQAGVLTEPGDPAYVRRPFVLGNVDSGFVSDVSGGTVGPATVTWGLIGFAALFDAQTGGNLLLWLPLPQPRVVSIGQTITSGNGTSRFMFPELQQDGQRTVIFPAGAIVARTSHDRVLTAGVSLQIVGGTLAAQVLTLGTTVTMSTLPSSQQQSESGRLWNNGGVVSIS